MNQFKAGDKVICIRGWLNDDEPLETGGRYTVRKAIMTTQPSIILEETGYGYYEDRFVKDETQ